MGSLSLPSVNIIDIRQDEPEKSLSNIVQQSLTQKPGAQRSLTTLLLYDDKGLRLFEDITYLDVYYLTNAEIEALSKHADAIVARIPADSQLVELGSGNLRKVNILLKAFEKAKKRAHYYALDLSHSELQRTFLEIDTDQYEYVTFSALLGTYDDGFAWLANRENKKTTCVMTLGSSIGNFPRNDAAGFLRDIREVLGPEDMVLVGLDSCQDRDRVHAAYNDSDGLTEQFYRNGLDHANAVLGRQVFKQDQWSVEGIYDTVDHKHQASYVCLHEVTSGDLSFHKGEKIFLEYAYKYSEEQCDVLWHKAGFIHQSRYGNTKGDYYLHLLSPSRVNFPDRPSIYAANPVPTLENWLHLWNAWDTVTKAMVPRDELLNKPIQLRNTLIFYLGHIPAFADIHFTRATKGTLTEPVHYATIFERGIDPDVDDPEKCHDHSPIPDQWPPLEEILGYETRVRARIVQSMQSGLALKDRKLGRSLSLAFEHEAMHLETFLYMLLQSQRILPPPGQAIPDFEALAHDAEKGREANQWHAVPTADIQIGMDDLENDLPPDRYFLWDNERPARQVTVPGFQAQSRPISNGEYARFLEETKKALFPASWTTHEDTKDAPYERSINGPVSTEKTVSAVFLKGKAVRTVYGLIPLRLALDWPVMASYDELAAYAEWAGGRIPTFEEVKSIYDHVENLRAAAEKVSSKLISAVNGHLCNEGVEETPPSQSLSPNAVGTDSATFSPDNSFIDLSGNNVAFKTWHTTPVTGDGNRLRGQSDAGGLWEWTSSPLTKHEGFKPMDLYPGYTADFFDNKHNVCLGGSWATVPRIAGRRSFVNWYQRNYPYTWATARLVRQLE